jgi:N-acetylglucosaminyldiphosphoundecaprenol N-acetyl-beta-D-mannosaminyltransferase
MEESSTTSNHSFRHLLGTRVDATSYTLATKKILDMVALKKTGYVCAANVHMLMEAYDDQSFSEIVNDACLVTPDGMPLVWFLRQAGFPDQQRVYGPTLMLHVCEAAAKQGIKIGLLGSRPDVIKRLKSNLRQKFHGLEVAYAHAPGFGSLASTENNRIIDDIRTSGARILFVALGCPKQERWMSDNSSQISGVTLGVGAAFDFHAGTLRQAPKPVQQLGLEWGFRLLMEPRRLGHRYIKHNPRFVLLALKQLLKDKLYG